MSTALVVIYGSQVCVGIRLHRIFCLYHNWISYPQLAPHSNKAWASRHPLVQLEIFKTQI